MQSLELTVEEIDICGAELWCPGLGCLPLLMAASGFLGERLVELAMINL